MNKIIGLFYLILVSMQGNAENIAPSEVLKFELSPYKNTPLFCENKTSLTPEKSAFSLVNYSMMSSDKGERYVLATIKNTSGGQRILKAEHIVAVFGDCSRALPNIAENKFSAHETKTLYLPFGISKHPILQLQRK